MGGNAPTLKSFTVSHNLSAKTWHFRVFKIKKRFVKKHFQQEIDIFENGKNYVNCTWKSMHTLPTRIVEMEQVSF